MPNFIILIWPTFRLCYFWQFNIKKTKNTFDFLKINFKVFISEAS